MLRATTTLCVAAVGSTTLSLRAQHVLLDLGIRADVIALSPGETKNGCAFGVTFPCAQSKAVRAALTAARVPISQYFTKEGAPL